MRVRLDPPGLCRSPTVLFVCGGPASSLGRGVSVLSLTAERVDPCSGRSPLVERAGHCAEKTRQVLPGHRGA